MPRLTGSCLCGAVHIAIDGPVHTLQACHCARCRKFYGGAFGPIAVVDRATFRYVRGQDHIAEFQSSERVTRTFCRTCGSPLPIVAEWDPLVGVPAGMLDDDPGMPLQGHIFVGSKAPWYTISGDATQSHTWPVQGDMDDRFEALLEESVC